ncbi:MAG TPA: hypothetical protein VE544_09940 [Nitrososphaeraceae archaeon]|nr:hypothetical protein [Nitrososphaeraceae archaeon]
MSTRLTLLMPTVLASLVVMLATLVIPAAQAQNENMTMEESTNASLAQFPEMDENADNVTDMEEETNALVGNVTGNMTSQNMTFGNMTS